MPGVSDRIGHLAGDVPGEHLGAAGPRACLSTPASADASMPVRSSPSVLADRIAASLIHHEPGWRLPRQSAMARRFGASPTEIDEALRDLVARRLVRRLPDGQLYRASPADYLIRLEGVPGLDSIVDPMGEVIACESFQVSCRRVPEKIAQALEIDPDSVCVARLVWTANGQPAALVTTYLRYLRPAMAAGLQPIGLAAEVTVFPPVLADHSGDDADEGCARPLVAGAVSIEMMPPPASVARALRISVGALATLLTVRFDDAADRTPAALTTVVLRPDTFRIVLEWPNGQDLVRGLSAQALNDAQP